MRKLKYLFKQLRRIPRKKVAKNLSLLLHANEMEYLMNMTTNIRVYRYSTYNEVEITSYRPGLYIGKGGETSKFLAKKLSEYTNTPTRITFKEPTLWRNLYL